MFLRFFSCISETERDADVILGANCSSYLSLQVLFEVCFATSYTFCATVYPTKDRLTTKRTSKLYRLSPKRSEISKNHKSTKTSLTHQRTTFIYIIFPYFHRKPPCDVPKIDVEIARFFFEEFGPVSERNAPKSINSGRLPIQSSAFAPQNDPKRNLMPSNKCFPRFCEWRRQKSAAESDAMTTFRSFERNSAVGVAVSFGGFRVSEAAIRVIDVV